MPGIDTKGMIMTRHVLIPAATLLAALSATPAVAVDRPAMANATAAARVTVHRGQSTAIGDVHRDRFDRRRGFGDVGYLAIPEYQGDSAFRPDGFNDWWHSRPDRSEPRWLRSNNCERQYWTGGGWRC